MLKMSLNLILTCAIHLTLGIMGIVGVETKEDETEYEKEDNKNVEYIDNSLINIYEKIQFIKTRNDKGNDKFIFYKNVTNEINNNKNNYNMSKPIPIPVTIHYT